MTDEINIINYIKVIIKRKWLILITVFIVLILGLIFSVRTQKEYKDTVVLEIGQMYIYKSGAPSTFNPETVSQIQEKIDNNLYKDSLKGVNASEITKVEVIIPEGGDNTKKESRIAVISGTSTSPKYLKLYLEKLGQVIVDQHKDKFKKQENYFENIISLEKEKLGILDRSPDLQALQYLYVGHLSIIDDAEKSLNSTEQTKILKSPSEKVGAQKNNLLMKLFIFLIVGLLLGVALAFIKEFFVKNKDLLRD